MKSNVLFLTFSIITSILFFTACEKDNTITTTNEESNELKATEKFKVVDGVLHFLDKENYLKDAYEIMNFSEKKFNEWEQNLGFKSLQSWIHQANKELDLISSKGEYNQWIKKYEDIIKIENNEIKPRIEDNFALSFSNRKGEFIIGEGYGKAFPNKTIFIQNGDKSMLNEAMQMKSSNLKKGIVVEDHTINKHIYPRNGCPSLTDEWRWKSKRGVQLVFHIEANADYTSGDIFTEVWIALHAKRKNWLGNIKSDEDHLKVMELEYSVTDNYNYTHIVDIPTSGEPDPEQQSRIRHLTNCGDYTPSGSYQLPTFNYSKAKGTRHALDWNKYAVICCGFPSIQCPATDG